jgi:hypothetical protein
MFSERFRTARPCLVHVDAGLVGGTRMRRGDNGRPAGAGEPTVGRTEGHVVDDTADLWPHAAAFRCRSRTDVGA